ncbi:sugar phosphate isomerase/epimerase family protein [Rhodococcus qingshengii]|uniref:sugar phosphate isomerase/epimerase family protein n=1 Tax=Rhodococcus TaxID=1827 RepID=UPI001BB0A5D7|nr:sugar phosphate isomerase/epimerase family protein [Rhodococcus qingshengii]MBS3694129.1 sugar phosphate isomerase/epimerase [Rhodococcus qingshengii]
MDISRCSLNSATIRGADLNEVVDLAEHSGFGGVGLWRDVLDDCDLVSYGREVAERGLRVTSVCRGGMFPQPDKATRRKTLEDNYKAVDQASDLNADCLVLVCGAAVGRDLTGGRSQIFDGIAELEPYAREAGVRLAIEPMHPMMASTRSAITSLREANDIVERIDSSHVGIALDSYHVWWDAELSTETTRAAGSILSVQIADWMTPIHDELSSRGMPGDGCIELPAFLKAATTAGYDGLVEVEVLSNFWWRQPPTDAVTAAVHGLRRI